MDGPTMPAKNMDLAIVIGYDTRKGRFVQEWGEIIKQEASIEFWQRLANGHFTNLGRYESLTHSNILGA
jgi:hypothetical protein